MSKPSWSAALVFTGSFTLAGCASPPPTPPPQPICTRAYLGAPGVQPPSCHDYLVWYNEAWNQCFSGPFSKQLSDFQVVEPCAPGPDGRTSYAGAEYTCCVLPDPPIRRDAGVDQR